MIFLLLTVMLLVLLLLLLLLILLLLLLLVHLLLLGLGLGLRRLGLAATMAAPLAHLLVVGLVLRQDLLSEFLLSLVDIRIKLVSVLAD